VSGGSAGTDTANEVEMGGGSAESDAGVSTGVGGGDGVNLDINAAGIPAAASAQRLTQAQISRDNAVQATKIMSMKIKIIISVLTVVIVGIVIYLTVILPAGGGKTNSSNGDDPSFGLGSVLLDEISKKDDMSTQVKSDQDDPPDEETPEPENPDASPFLETSAVETGAGAEVSSVDARMADMPSAETSVSGATTNGMPSAPTEELTIDLPAVAPPLEAPVADLIMEASEDDDVSVNLPVTDAALSSETPAAAVSPVETLPAGVDSELYDAVAGLPHRDALSVLWSHLGGYWTAADNQFIGFTTLRSRYFIELGYFETEWGLEGELVDAVPTGVYKATLTIRVPAQEANMLFDARPEMWVDIYLDADDLLADGAIRIKMDIQGTRGWYQYTWAGKSFEEAYGNRVSPKTIVPPIRARDIDPVIRQD
jgi:hypothetical protein